MLVAGKTRGYSLPLLLLFAFLLFLLLTYNPRIPEDSAQTLRSTWAKISTEHPPAWVGNGVSHPPVQETLPFSPELQHGPSELPAANPDPYAAIGGANGGGDAGKTLSSGSTVGGNPSSDTDELAGSKPDTEKSEMEKQQQYIKDHMGVPLTANAQPFTSPAVDPAEVAKNYNEISSMVTKDGAYFHLNFVHYAAFNPSLIPHPRLEHTWIMTAQRLTIDRGFPSGWSDEIACEVRFNAYENNNMTCRGIPVMLAVGATQAPRGPDGCPEHLQTLHMNIGPHDARVYFGPRFPYIMYGSQSQFKCFGQWTHDFRMVYDWGHFRNYSDPFDRPTEIQRPEANGVMEKNYFMFWDFDDQPYAHYDTAPQRAYAKIGPDGSAGPDLAPQARANDEACWRKHLTWNPVPPESEAKSSIHQATNSLSVTMCERKDPSCRKTKDNTYIIQIYQHKIGNGLMHARYEPYVMVFKREAPFEMHAVSAKPLWIRGRTSKAEMIYVTSINWKVRDLNYSGFLDDVIFVGFGVEDKRTGAVDVTAKDLLGELMPC